MRPRGFEPLTFGSVEAISTPLLPLWSYIRAQKHVPRSPQICGVRDISRDTLHVTVWCYHDVMTKNLTVRLDSELAADAEAIARADGTSLNETIKQALSEAVQRRRHDPKFKARLHRILEEDRELLERLAK
jgi:hypothetical protein